MTLRLGDGGSDTALGDKRAAENSGCGWVGDLRGHWEGGWVAGAQTPGCLKPRVGAPGLSLGDIVHAGKRRANVFSPPVESDSERRGSRPGRREPDSAVSEADFSQMLKS